MNARIKAVLLTGAVLSSFLAIAPLSHAALSSVGPVDPDNGFPAWYQDATGLSLAPCFDNNGFCSSTMVAGPGDPFNPALPIVFPTNFPQIFFYFKADAFANTTHYTAALEGAFGGTGTVAPGQQLTFSRIRITDSAAPAGTYTITHPYSVDVLEVTAADVAAGIGLRFTEDLGFGGTPFTGVLGGRIGPFLRRAGGLVTSPDGKVYMGDSVTGVVANTGPGTATASVIVEGPISATTNTFILEGKVIGMTVTPNRPPSVPGLVSPADGASGLPATVTLIWTKATDNDGDALSYQVFLCNDPSFIGCNAIVVAAPGTRLNAVYFAGLGSLGMVLFGLIPIGGIKGRKRIMLVLTITAMTGVLIYSCGGSGGSGGEGSGSDTTSPTVPVGVTATAVSASQIDVAWTASSDNVGVAGYTIFRGGTFLTSVTNGTSIAVTGLNPSTNYCYTVNAHDAAGNESAQSSPACATTESGVIAPSIELSFTATGLNPGALYFWKVAADDGKGGVAVSETRSFRTQ